MDRVEIQDFINVLLLVWLLKFKFTRYLPTKLYILRVNNINGY